VSEGGGTLDRLRRDEWPTEPPGAQPSFFKLDDIERLCRAHAVLAKITYVADNTDSYLLLRKATLMGDESRHLLTYHAVHLDFPTSRRLIGSLTRLNGRVIAGSVSTSPSMYFRFLTLDL
jgi:hypothetical protein